MATQDDVRRLVLALPETAEDPNYFSFSVAGKGFVWAWRQRVDPKKARVPRDDVVAIRVAHELEKDALIDLDADVFFTEPHYNGFPAILVRLPAIDLPLLEKLLRDGWRIQAPKRLVRATETESLTADGLTD